MWAYTVGISCFCKSVKEHLSHIAHAGVFFSCANEACPLCISSITATTSSQLCPSSNVEYISGCSLSTAIQNVIAFMHCSTKDTSSLVSSFCKLVNPSKTTAKLTCGLLKSQGKSSGRSIFSTLKRAIRVDRRLNTCSSTFFPVKEGSRPQDYNFFMLSSAKHEIFSGNKYENANFFFSANKYENANNSWHFHIY